jgi:hypothetical protein
MENNMTSKSSFCSNNKTQNMNKIASSCFQKSLYWLLPVIFLVGMLPMNASAKSGKKDKAQIAYNQKNYATALLLWNKTIAKYEKRNKGIQCPVYAKAAMAALKLGKEGEARSLLTKAIYSTYAKPTDFIQLAHLYRKINNLSLEMDALEKYAKKYPSGKDISTVHERLFATYVESENWQEAIQLWEKLPASFRTKPENKTGMLKAYMGQEDKASADKLAAEILTSDPKNLTALSWLGKKYFWKAENRYQSEMKAYNQNKTRQQYVHLLHAFKLVTVDFKKSLLYFRKLYSLQPNAENALFLGNIYARLDNPAKAKYYHHLAQQKK